MDMPAKGTCQQLMDRYAIALAGDVVSEMSMALIAPMMVLWS
jgi:hypothetical protein